MSDRELPDDFENVVKNIINYLAYKSKFAYHERDDIAQEIWVFCLDGLSRYDGKRSLYNFLLTHVKNRLKSFKRDTYFRYDCPCKLCSFKKDGETGHKNKKYCKLYSTWLEVNTRKKNIASPMFTDFYRNEKLVDKHASHEDVVDQKDFFENIDRNLPLELREYYLKIRSGVYVSKKHRELVVNFIKELVKDEK